MPFNNFIDINDSTVNVRTLEIVWCICLFFNCQIKIMSDKT